MNKAQLVEAVRDHAKANYEVDGWDYVVEALDDAELIEEFGDAATPEEAISRISVAMKLLDGHRREMTPMAGWDY